MLRRVILDIDGSEGGKARVLPAELERELAAEGIGLEQKDGGTGPEEGALYLTDRPQKVRGRHGEDCCVLLYLTEENRGEGFDRTPYAVESLEGLDADFLKKVWQRHAGEPWEILRTQRLRVREMTEGDLDTLYEIYAHPDMTLYTEGPDPDRGMQQEKLAAYIGNVYPIYGFGLWMIEEQKSGRGIGRAGFFWREGAAYPELGFAVEKRSQGKGYCLEACGAILEYGFGKLGFAGVQAVTEEGNEASRRILRRLGFWEKGPEEGGRTLWLNLRTIG